MIGMSVMEDALMVAVGGASLIGVALHSGREVRDFVLESREKWLNHSRAFPSQGGKKSVSEVAGVEDEPSTPAT